MSLSRDLIEILGAFAARNVRYLIVGGHAVSLHARPRSTKDLDLWLQPTRANVLLACAALAEFGVPKHLVDELSNARPDEIVWLGRPPSRVDFLQTLPGLTFDEAWPNRVAVIVDETRLHFIGRDDLIRNKKAVGRPTDRRDVIALERAAKGTLSKRKPARRGSK
jgi:hypothetical protein